MMTIDELISEVYKVSQEHGWWDLERPFIESLMLVVCEIAEATEEYRNHHAINEIYYETNKPGKCEGVPIEIADAIIRIFDLCGGYNIDLSEALRLKMAYNVTREYRHGGKRL